MLVRELPRLAGQGRDQLAALDVEGPQLVTGQALLRLADQLAELDQGGDLVAGLADRGAEEAWRGNLERMKQLVESGG